MLLRNHGKMINLLFTSLVLSLALVATNGRPAEAAEEQQAETAPPVVTEQPLAAEPGVAEPFALPEFMQPQSADFSYRLTGRADPFMPFLEAATRSAAALEEDLTGLRRFEPGQLTLTAIIVGEPENLAMVEDATGRGHVIRPGTAIGRNGRVDRISPGLVAIGQPSVSPTGETEYRTIEILLNPEGDKKE